MSAHGDRAHGDRAHGDSAHGDRAPGDGAPGDRRLRIVVVYPDLLGTYGDGGNGLVLERRARWRGIDAELCEAASGGPLPTADVYCLGGGEDGPQVQAAESLRADRSFGAAVASGAVVLAVCAGFQIAGLSFPDAAGRSHEGLGLLQVETFRRDGPRMVGEVLADPSPVPGTPTVLPRTTGFENHGAATRLVGAEPLGRVVAGAGNGDGDGGEGAWGDRVVGTYMHGPFLARNPAFADLLLQWALRRDEPLPALDDREEEELRAERLATVSAAMR
jgi:lipid II isoglutaminyl synthase (glutamine-hydrolysing)